jgi:hypothetical protein
MYRLMIAPLKGERVPISGNNLNKSKFPSGKIKRWWKSGNVFYHLMLNLFSSSFYSKLRYTELYFFLLCFMGVKHVRSNCERNLVRKYLRIAC